MDFPDDILYSEDHIWVRQEDDGEVVLGVTDFAQDQLGKIIFLDLPEEGDAVAAGDEMGAIESAKSVSDLIAPLDGQVAAVNASLEDEPALVNQDPYGAGWLLRIKPEAGLPDDLMNAADYQQLIEDEA